MPIFDRARSYFCSRSRSNSRSGSAGQCSQPLAGDLALELAGPPAGIAERQDRPVGPLAAGDGLQDVDGGGQRHAVVDGQRRIGGEVVGAVQHEAAPGLDRAADMHVHVDQLDLARRRLSPGTMLELLQQLAEADVRARWLMISPIAPSAECAHM